MIKLSSFQVMTRWIGPVRKFSQSFSGPLALRSKILSTVALANQASMQLRVAEDNVARREQELWGYKERAERAEGWLQRISQEIEQAFSSRQPDAYAPRRSNIER